MVEDTEPEVRTLLAACALEFNSACLDFHKTERAIRTAGSEQVPQLIFREGAENWRQFETWLGPLQAALGLVVATYPESGDVHEFVAKLSRCICEITAQ